ncbi:BolA family protein [Oceanibium sediminis]|uniref:BolA family protein n=1 Tax=Oceanibium sediminis TaxID=2026339 RepID=UPI000DD2EC40|nr:BolA family protein [Oceanibium sediminis]
MTTAEIIEQKLRDAFAPTLLEVVDDSESHRGHGGFREGVQTHFNVKIRAAAFAGQGRVARQRMVMKVLSEEMAGPVHALALDVAAP